MKTEIIEKNGKTYIRETYDSGTVVEYLKGVEPPQDEVEVDPLQELNRRLEEQEKILLQIAMNTVVPAEAPSIPDKLPPLPDISGLDLTAMMGEQS